MQNRILGLRHQPHVLELALLRAVQAVLYPSSEVFNLVVYAYINTERNRRGMRMRNYAEADRQRQNMREGPCAGADSRTMKRRRHNTSSGRPSKEKGVVN
jgi:hypothetical protein